MAIKTLTSIVTDNATDGPALAALQALAPRFGAAVNLHCLGIDATRYETLPTGSAAMIDIGQDEAVARSEELTAWAQSQMPSAPGVQIEPSVTAQLLLERHVARVARYTDLVVASQPYRTDCSALSPMVIEAALFGANRPVMIVPDAPLRPFNRVLVAWNESDEALRAIQHALPILSAAEHVDVVMIDPPARSNERSDPGGALSLWLARHGAHCEVSVLSKTLPRIADVLMRFASDRQSDLIVMGAYGHSRFREALLGGPTRDLLEEADQPVFMAR